MMGEKFMWAKIYQLCQQLAKDHEENGTLMLFAVNITNLKEIEIDNDKIMKELKGEK